MPNMSLYCKAYPANRFEEFPEWSILKKADPGPEPGLPDILYLHDNHVVTRGVFLDQNVVFDAVTPEWRDFCSGTLLFAIPEDLVDRAAESDKATVLC